MEVVENNKIGNIEALEKDNQIGIKSENSPFATTFYFEEYYDDVAVKKFLKNTERLIRQSREYHTYIELLRGSYSVLNRDNILSNLTNADVDMEFHHFPFSLYDICSIVLTKHMLDKKNISSFGLAKEVMELHYKHFIGLVSLMETNHDLAHNGSIFISKKQIFGDYSSFMKLYDKAIPNALKEKVKIMEDLSDKGIPVDFGGLYGVSDDK